MPKETFSGFSPEQKQTQEERKEFEQEIKKDLEQKGEISTGIKGLFKRKDREQKIIGEIKTRAEKKDLEREIEKQKQEDEKAPARPKQELLSSKEVKNKAKELIIDSKYPNWSAVVNEMAESYGITTRAIMNVLKSKLFIFTRDEAKKLKPEMNNKTVDGLRGFLAKATRQIGIYNQAKPFLKHVQDIAEKEPKQIHGIKAPARFFLHFYNDLKWLWGIEEEDFLEDVNEKSNGGRIGDSQDANW